MAAASCRRPFGNCVQVPGVLECVCVGDLNLQIAVTSLVEIVGPWPEKWQYQLQGPPGRHPGSMQRGGDPPYVEKVAPRIPRWRRLGFPRRPLAARLELPGFNFGASFGSLISSTDFVIIFVRSWVPRAPKKLSFHWKGCQNQLSSKFRFKAEFDHFGLHF